jgi:molybdate transport system substrate-binding protein
VNRRHRLRAVALAAVVALAVAGCGGAEAAGRGEDGGPLLVAAASDLQPAFTELGDLYTQQTGREVTLTFGSSGQLAQQLENGGPYDVFASANVDFVDEVLAAGVGDPATKTTYAFGRIVVWTRADSGLGTPTVEQLADPSFARIAVANPDHAPYGVAAVEALQHAGVYETVRDRLVYGENVTDTLRLAASGNVDVAIVALSLAVSSTDSRYSEIPADFHEPLEQALVVTASGERAAAATEFTELVDSPEGREVMNSYGFVLPGEPAPVRED